MLYKSFLSLHLSRQCTTELEDFTLTLLMPQSVCGHQLMTTGILYQGHTRLLLFLQKLSFLPFYFTLIIHRPFFSLTVKSRWMTQDTALRLQTEAMGKEEEGDRAAGQVGEEGL